MTTNWKTYEEVAEYLLNQFADTFSLGHVEGKQVVSGISGTQWEIDAKGVLDNNEGFIIIECRCYKNKICQEQIAGLAYRIQDTGAKGGIFVSPVDFQKGAEIVAKHEKIPHVILSKNSTTREYIMRFLNDIFTGFCDNIILTESFTIKVLND